MNGRRAMVIGVSLVWVMAIAGVTAAGAQPAGFKRTVLQRSDISIPGREAVMAKIEFGPGVQSGRHTHPGEEAGYVLDGALRFDIEGKAPVTLKAGEAFFIEAGRPHNVLNEGPAAAAILGTYIVEKGKPLATPAP